jgi:hypothetical protein
VRINRNDGPEDSSLPERLPHRWTTRVWHRHRQLPAHRADARWHLDVLYDVGQGQGWQRNIVMDGSPHLPPGIRQGFGDSRGHWEGNTLVVDVTYFSPKTEGNYGLPGLLRGRRVEEAAFAEGRGPDPAAIVLRPGFETPG